MNVIGWPNNVNQKILSDTGITIGDGGFIEDQNANGWQDRRLTALAIPDSFQVTMDFDWGGDDALFPRDLDGFSEYDRFMRWYKYSHKRGSNPFWFPCITKHPVSNLLEIDTSKMCLYKITSSLSVKDMGLTSRITMTWKEVYSGIIEVPEQELLIDRLKPHADYTEVVFNDIPDNQPIFSDFEFYYQKEGEELAQRQLIKMSGNGKTFNIYYLPLKTGNYSITVNYQNATKTAPLILQ